MSGLLHYCASYILDFFRERITLEEIQPAPTRVLVCGEGMANLAQQFFPEAAVTDITIYTSLTAIRRIHFDVALIAMTGGELRPRWRALWSGVRHKILVPAPEYLYRFGMRAGPVALTWAIIDRFLFAPIALAWLGLMEFGQWALLHLGAKKSRSWYDAVVTGKREQDS